jgi:hypothetical protein
MNNVKQYKAASKEVTTLDNFVLAELKYTGNVSGHLSTAAVCFFL